MQQLRFSSEVLCYVLSCFPVQSSLWCPKRQILLLPWQSVCIAVIIKTLFLHILKIKASVSELGCFSILALVPSMFYYRFIGFWGFTGHWISLIRVVFAVHLFMSPRHTYTTLMTLLLELIFFMLCLIRCPCERLCRVNFEKCSINNYHHFAVIFMTIKHKFINILDYIYLLFSLYYCT